MTVHERSDVHVGGTDSYSFGPEVPTPPVSSVPLPTPSAPPESSSAQAHVVRAVQTGRRKLEPATSTWLRYSLSASQFGGPRSSELNAPPVLLPSQAVITPERSNSRTHAKTSFAIVAAQATVYRTSAPSELSEDTLSMTTVDVAPENTVVTAAWTPCTKYACNAASNCDALNDRRCR